MRVEKLYTYPVKALRAVELDSVQVTKHGFPHDRRFMILQCLRDEKTGTTQYKNIHVAHYPESVHFHPSLDLAADLVTITFRPPHGKEQAMDFPLKPYTDDLEVIDVEMHKSPVQAYKMLPRYNEWLSQCYGFEVALAYLGPNYRPVLMSSGHNKQAPQPLSNGNSNGGRNGWLSSLTSILPTGKENAGKPEAEITFADCAPYLICSRASVDDLHHRLPEGEEMDILKFRPNIIVSGAPDAWDEDYWGQITISGDTKIECIHNCGRCKSINIDYETGKPGEGPSGQMLKQMQRDRRVDPGMKYSPIFGRYSFLHPESEGNEIHVGDEVVVSSRLKERTRFDWAGLATT